jgi:SHS2 domain-containing protein
MASSAGGEFTALPPRDCIRKRTRRPADQVPIAAAAAAAARREEEEDEVEEEPVAATATADGGEEEQQEDGTAADGEGGKPASASAAAPGAAAAATAAEAGGKAEPHAAAAAAAAHAANAAAAHASAADLPAYRSCAEQGNKYEYLDHTADVQIHAWGATLEEALENAGLAMFNYMTPLAGITAPTEGQQQEQEQEDGGSFRGRRFEAEGHDVDSLVFAFLDELLFAFASDFAVCSELKVTKLVRGGGGEAAAAAAAGGGAGAAAASADGAKWRVEALGAGERFDRDRHEAGTEIKAITYSAMQVIEKEGDAEIFVIVDI